MNETDVMNLLEVRKIVETGAAAVAAKRRTEENLSEMKKALEDMKMANGNEEIGEKSDLDFHLAIAMATQNDILFKLLTEISELIQETMR